MFNLTFSVISSGFGTIKYEELSFLMSVGVNKAKHSFLFKVKQTVSVSATALVFLNVSFNASTPNIDPELRVLIRNNTLLVTFFVSHWFFPIGHSPSYMISFSENFKGIK